MATTYTPNYNLGKQTDVNDLFSMSVITGNMDKIDTQMKKAENLYTVDFINGTDLSLSNVVWMKKIPNASYSERKLLMGRFFAIIFFKFLLHNRMAVFDICCK